MRRRKGQPWVVGKSVFAHCAKENLLGRFASFTSSRHSRERVDAHGADAHGADAHERFPRDHPGCLRWLTQRNRQMIPGSNVSRALARTGVDWVLVDCEHGNMDGEFSVHLFRRCWSQLQSLCHRHFSSILVTVVCTIAGDDPSSTNIRCSVTECKSEPRGR